MSRLILKDGARILAIDDSSFNRRSSRALAIGIIGRGNVVEGALSFKVAVDGNDSTAQVIKAVRGSRFRPQIKVIIMNGILLGGLNVVNVAALCRTFNLPVIAVTRKKPHPEMLRSAILKNRVGSRAKLRALEESMKGISLCRHKGYYLQLVGIDRRDAARRFEEMLAFLRLARIIGSGISKGESRGRM